MFRQDNEKATREVVSSLRNALNGCTSDISNLRNCLDRQESGTNEDAKEFAKNVAADAERLRKDVEPLQILMQRTPRASNIFNAAFAELDAIGHIFDQFQEHVKEKYGVEPVKVHSLVENTTDSNSIFLRSQSSGISCKEGAVEQIEGRLRSWTPPAIRVRSSIEAAIPATPRLEDFGLKDEDMRALGISVAGNQDKENFKNGYLGAEYGTSIGGNTGVEIGEGDNYETMEVQSMVALGIENPTQLAKRFAVKRNVALKEVLQTTTPRVKAGSRERTLDYTGLAKGYFAANVTEAHVDNLHRTLNFGETPIGKGVQKAKIGLRYDELDAFWKSSLDFSVVQDSCMLLDRQPENEFSKTELLKLLKSSVPSGTETIIVMLNKMKILQVKKPVGMEEVYRFCGSGDEL